MDLRKLDALVAEKIMGWTFKEITRRQCERITGEVGRTCLWFDPWGSWHDDPPRFSADLVAAWQVVEHLSAANWWVIKSPFYVGAPYSAGLTPHNSTGWNGRPDYFATASTAPLAICLCALKLFGVDASEFEAA